LNIKASFTDKFKGKIAYVGFCRLVVVRQLVKPVFVIFDISPACTSALKECLGRAWELF
jgi:hypothetical protein